MKKKRTIYLMLLVVGLLGSHSGNCQYRGLNEMMRAKVAGGICTQPGTEEYDEEVAGLVALIMERYGAASRIGLVSCMDTESAEAVVDERGRPYIKYNPYYLAGVRRLSFTNTTVGLEPQDWKRVVILAHEIGHHINYHLVSPEAGMSRKEMELEADETAGFVAYKLGARLSEAQLVLYDASVPEAGSITHPPRKERLAALARGYERAKALSPQRDEESMAWEFALSLDTESGYVTFLEKFPSGRYAEEAKARLAAMRPEEELPHGVVMIRGGSFEMGSRDGEDLEMPAHRVTLDNFYLSRYEVTLGEFKTFIEATGYRTDAERSGRGSLVIVKEWEDGSRSSKYVSGMNWRHDPKGQLRDNTYEGNHPVYHVSWNDAIQYCNWLSRKEGLREVYRVSGNRVSADWTANGYRLPTEAEWEYAARSGGKAYPYAWSNGNMYGNIDDGLTWSSDPNYKDWYKFTSPAGKFVQGELGLTDMTGNVSEWCWDWLSVYQRGALQNPKGPGEPDDDFGERVFRGGYWGDDDLSSRTYYRGGELPDFSTYEVGFRLARSFIK